MCLTITEIPKRGDPLVIQTYKQLNRRKDGTYYTPHRIANIPYNGFLKPVAQLRYYKIDLRRWFYKRRSTKQIGAVIEEGAIHSYSQSICKPRSSYNAYAFGVYAYGRNHDVASKYLYIPSCDKSLHKHKRVRMCEKWVSGKEKPTWAKINKLFEDCIQ